MSEQERFWMVSGNGPSNVRHGSRGKAEEEAARLAAAHPGVSFFVMEAVAVFQSKGVERRLIGEQSERRFRKSLEEIVDKTAGHSIAGTLAREALQF